MGKYLEKKGPSGTERGCLTTFRASRSRQARRDGWNVTPLLEIRGMLKVFSENLIRDPVAYTEHAMRDTVIRRDVLCALEGQGRTVRLWKFFASYKLISCLIVSVILIHVEAPILTSMQHPWHILLLKDLQEILLHLKRWLTGTDINFLTSYLSEDLWYKSRKYHATNTNVHVRQGITGILHLPASPELHLTIFHVWTKQIKQAEKGRAI